MLGGGRTAAVARGRAAGGLALAAALLCGCSTAPLKPRGELRLALPAAGAPARVVALATARGPAAPASTTTASAACPGGTILAGGGVSTTLIGGGTPPSSLHANGTGPSGTRPPTGWVALGASGGQIVLGGATTVAAMCLHATAGIGRPTAVIASVSGPSQPATTAVATASCGPGTLLLGGGGYATVSRGSTSPSLHLIGSFPSDAHGLPVPDGSPAPTAWTARGDAGGRAGSAVETIAVAICAPSRRATTVAVATAPGPLPASSATTATAACPAGTTLISGGARTGPASGTPQQGLHLTGSFPSDAGGRAAWSTQAGAAVNAWSARAESGGQGSPGGTVTTAFAVCLRP